MNRVLTLKLAYKQFQYLKHNESSDENIFIQISKCTFLHEHVWRHTVYKDAPINIIHWREKISGWWRHVNLLFTVTTTATGTKGGHETYRHIQIHTTRSEQQGNGWEIKLWGFLKCFVKGRKVDVLALFSSQQVYQSGALFVCTHTYSECVSEAMGYGAGKKWVYLST